MVMSGMSTGPRRSVTGWSRQSGKGSPPSMLRRSSSGRPAGRRSMLTSSRTMQERLAMAWGQTGVMQKTSAPGWMMGPPAERL